MARFNVDDGDNFFGGAEDDLFVLFENYASGTLDGGGGIDRLDPFEVKTIFPSATLRNIEVLALDGSQFAINAANMVTFDTIVADDGATTANLVFSTGDAFTFTTVTELQTLNVLGANDSDDVLLATAGAVVTNITFDARDGDDVVRLGAGGDTLSGGAGDDTLNGGAGGDLIDGGADADTASYGDAAAAVSADLATGKATTGADVDTLLNLENLEGSAFADTMGGDDANNTLAGLGGNDVLAGRGGFDTLDGGAGIDTANYADEAGAVSADLAAGKATTSGNGNDTLVSIENLQGSAQADELAGDAGDNRLRGADGDDTLAGRAGNDFLDGGAGFDTASYVDQAGGVSVDLAFGQASTFTGVDDLVSIEGVEGSNGVDLLSGDGAANTLEALGGNDRLVGRGGADRLAGGDGIDQLAGDNGADALEGGRGADRLEGGAGGDNLAGGGGADRLEGGSGNDRLAGGAGDDDLVGGGGADVFAFAASGGADNVLGFQNGVDKLSFAGFGPAFDSAGEIIDAADRVGGNTVIALPNFGPAPGSTVVTLVGFDLGDLNAADFGPIVA